ncbi:hypothetical protein BE11_12365 [Sorangium cellulosum]|nr:hypothetical protein BE11_12365 [Sorangium cellulosum]
MITGAMYTTPAVDIDLRGPLPLQWVRQYRSSAVRRQCGVGWGWTHAFAWWAEIGPTGITVVDSEGSALVFPRLEEGEYALAPFGRRLERRGADLVLITRDRVERILRRGEEGGGVDIPPAQVVRAGARALPDAGSARARWLSA